MPSRRDSKLGSSARWRAVNGRVGDVGVCDDEGSTRKARQCERTTTRHRKRVVQAKRGVVCKWKIDVFVVLDILKRYMWGVVVDT